mmetsp:Transcript_16189/g.31674  ORF Transcript_16189/g.31674 Transcript_16189/m.31674 type:complete len:198 (+) Transcript_16189:144-737(+)|eukprot:CAMPEP_0172715040 /NCGR_PEP_ID=MMETSP1074-20121228/67318_1 /TAXON_ID=2916 /ORGANISM="Ceratium fusus, Strain PA161109" /LENGTH=197 /DNA_ID=CAMNT_0013539577 /DNA_START=136 /DNA_END=729 /DNA_ORIENTATION=+
MSNVTTATINLRRTFSDLQAELISLQEHRARQYQQIMRLTSIIAFDQQGGDGNPMSTQRAGLGSSCGSKGLPDWEDDMMDPNACLVVTPTKQKHEGSVASSGNETDVDMPSLAAVTPYATPLLTPSPVSVLPSLHDNSPSTSSGGEEMQQQAASLPDLNSCWHPSKLSLALKGLQGSGSDASPSQDSLEASPWRVGK